MIPKHVSSIYSAACQNPNLDTGKVLWFTGFGTKKKKKILVLNFGLIYLRELSVMQ